MTDIHDYSTKRFLIVDDEPFMLSVIERILRRMKSPTLFTASGGADALRALKDHITQVDCIISDYNMKPVNGLQLLLAVRTGVIAHIPRDQPFIMLTGHGESEVVKTAITLDVSGYLVKPVAPEKLIQTLDWALKKSTEVKDADYYRGIRLGAVPR